MNKYDKALHDLICNSLRDDHVRAMSKDELVIYNYDLGVALHNVSHFFTIYGELPLDNLLSINHLDPSGTREKWGMWVTSLCTTIDQKLSDIPS